MLSPAGPSPRRLVWLDRSGRGDRRSDRRRVLLLLRHARRPDGRGDRRADPLPPDLWLFDTSAGRGIRVTRDAVAQLAPVISPDGRRIFCSAYSRGPGISGKRLREGDRPEALPGIGDDQDGQRHFSRRPVAPLSGIQSGNPRGSEGRFASGDRQPRTFVANRRRRNQRRLLSRRPLGRLRLGRVRPKGGLCGLVSGCRAPRSRDLRGRRAAPLEPRREGALLRPRRASSSPFPSAGRGTSSPSARAGPFPLCLCSPRATRASISSLATTSPPTADSWRSCAPCDRLPSRSSSSSTGPRR